MMRRVKSWLIGNDEKTLHPPSTSAADMRMYVYVYVYACVHMYIVCKCIYKDLKFASASQFV